MKEIIEENYKSIVKRGLINKHTSKREFILKLEEEVQEFIDAFIYKEGNEKLELADIVLVCMNIAKHYNIDLEKEIKTKIEINKNR